MKLVSVFIFLLLSFHLYSSENFILHSGSKNVSIPFKKYNGVLVNEKCLSKMKDCTALKTLFNKPKNIKPINMKSETLPHAAAVYCKRLGGVSLTLKNLKNEGTSFCAFQDKSIINSWGLLKAHTKGKK